MSTHKSILTLLLSVFISIPNGKAQTEIPVLSWRSHLSYHDIKSLAFSEDRLYSAAPNGVFSIDLEELSITKITKNDGLSDVSIGSIGYDIPLGLFVIGYASGNIDLITEDRITNINILKEANIDRSKQFHAIGFHEGLVYLSGDQGIIVIHPNRSEIVASYTHLGPSGELLAVYGTAFSNDSIYAATSSGILSASLERQVNKQDFNNWRRAFPALSFNRIEKLEANSFIARENDTLYAYNGNEWSVLPLTFTDGVTDITVYDSHLYVLSGQRVIEVQNGAVTHITPLQGIPTIYQRLLVNASGFWLGSEGNGVIWYREGNREMYFPPGPAQDHVWKAVENDNGIYVLGGGFSTDIMPFGRAGDLSLFSDNSWTTHPLVSTAGDTVRDLLDLLSVTGNGTYAASFSQGLLRLNDLQEVTIVHENSSNSTLQSANGSMSMTGIAKENGNLWMTNYGFERSLHRWEIESDRWTPYTFLNAIGRYPISLEILPNGDKWMAIDPNRGGGILVFNEENNRERYLTRNGGLGGLPGSGVTSMVLDRKDALWIGTHSGIAFFSNPFNILNNEPVTATVPVFENQLLLRNEFITAIAIDAGNRKWIGTHHNGIWLFDESGESLVYHFTEINSPLLSDSITAIHINDHTGEVFIGTSHGLVSFRSDATTGQPSHQNVRVFPNPVPLNFNGVVTISGLVNAAQVKITDVSGKLVKEILANGSTAIWDARSYNRQRVKTGIYLVFSTDEDGTETFVGKIAVI